jgi:dihydrofolate synthase/folylpolyglutamate synthase
MTPTTNLHAATFASYAAARQYLEPFAHQSGPAIAPQFAWQRAKALMAYLGNPQNTIPVIHLAGTSGKGSTATILAALLQAHGLCVGLGLSPHVRHLLERVQVNGAPVAEADFCRVLGEMVPAITTMQGSEWGAPSFFEILIALSYKLFAQIPVDVVVMETGLGGRYDATNVVTSNSVISANKIALFTEIGYDHVEILGNTLSKIAAQKAGIIQPHNRVLTFLQPPDAQAVIAAESAAQDAPLTLFNPATAIHHVRLHPTHVVFDLTLPTHLLLHDLQLSLTGAHQAENAGLAIAAAQLFLNGIGRNLDGPAIRHVLLHVTLPGRMDQRAWQGARFIIDGAHNPQKIQALCRALIALYPDQRLIFVVALKQGKDHSAILAQLLPLAAHIILTRFDNQDQGMPVEATDPDELAALIPQESDVPIHVVPDITKALALAVDLAPDLARRMGTPSAPIVVTGSLYLLAQVYAVLDGAGDAQ